MFFRENDTMMLRITNLTRIGTILAMLTMVPRHNTFTSAAEPGATLGSIERTDD